MDEIKNAAEYIVNEEKNETAAENENTAPSEAEAPAQPDTDTRCCCGADCGDTEETENDENTQVNTVVIDGAKITDKHTLHAYIAGVMQLPDYYGHNLDALYDCLTEIGTPVALSIINGDTLKEQIGENYFEAFKTMLSDAADANKNITVSFE